MGNVSSAVEGYMPFLKTFPKLLSLWGWGVSEIYIHTVARPNCDLKNARGVCRSGGKFCRRFHQVADKRNR